MTSGAPDDRRAGPADPHGDADLLRTAAHIGRVGGWAVYLSESAVYWSEQIFEMLDWPDRATPGLAEALALHDPAHRPMIREALARCAADGTPFDIEVALTSRRGRTVWARVVGAAEHDEDGALVRIAGALQDVT
ncbi:MAG: PAS domain-containing protein, partial [Thermoleophilia bacterium]